MIRAAPEEEAREAAAQVEAVPVAGAREVEAVPAVEAREAVVQVEEVPVGAAREVVVQVEALREVAAGPQEAVATDPC